MSSPRRPLATLGVVALAAGALLTAQPSDATAQPAKSCFFKPVTLAGTEGPDIEVGTFGRDVIATYGGNDVVRADADFGGFGGGDADTICMGPGDDVADGAAGADTIHGGDGNDVLDGELYSDGAGNDTIFGGRDEDTITGGSGDDLLLGGPGNDVIDPPGDGIGEPPSAGADRVYGGPGDDVVTEQLDGGTDTVDGGPGNDRCVVDTVDVVRNCETVIRVPAGG